MKSNHVIDDLKQLNAAVIQGDIKTVKKLCTQGNVNSTLNEKLFTPLHYAAFYNRIEIASHILSVVNCDINKRCNDGSTPLFLAAAAGNNKMVNFLLNNGAEVSPDLLNRFSASFEKKYPDILKVLQDPQKAANSDYSFSWFGPWQQAPISSVRQRKSLANSNTDMKNLKQ